MGIISDENQVITIKDRKILSMSGVLDIAGFDQGCILLDTSFGSVSVEGENLKIESLSDTDGRVLIKGEISGVYCSDAKETKKGFFGKLFGR